MRHYFPRFLVRVQSRLPMIHEGKQALGGDAQVPFFSVAFGRGSGRPVAVVRERPLWNAPVLGGPEADERAL